ncbi:MAG TPA: FecR domain-containing protein [Chitinophagaceae bacterium]|jgi:ferric-dicitrate binding protein FerR (iron transport regulator)|nr:FecR domain-containing protein [Chitinophagaceae bacterium]HMU59568.1 FecR domain-containing protein [Chitinophagaceae bacterium]
MEALFQKYLENQCSEEEMKHLFRLFNQNSDSTFLREQIAFQLENTEGKDAEGMEFQRNIDDAFINILCEINKEKTRKKASVIRLSGWKSIAAAIVLVFVIGGSIWLINQKQPENSIVGKTKYGKDVAPGGNKATLTLADGSTIILDSTANGNLTTQGNVNVMKFDGKLSYNQQGTTSEMLFNTVSTPKGGVYHLVLSDGSKVWLNSASSLRFPASFVGNERKVELTGEAYFEVEKNALMPFRVNVAGKEEVEVLGTDFNINSYSNEDVINTTLLKGKVIVTDLKTQHSQHLLPGQQAQIGTGGEIAIRNNVDTEEIIAWKNGLFHFESADLKTILRQFERWYDVEVVFEGAVSNRKFFVIISRNSSLSAVIDAMQANDIKFRIEGKRLIVQKG